MKETYKDTDLREALRRKYSDTPQLPADFMEKMQERMGGQGESSGTKPATKKRYWYWAAAAACLLIVGIGVTMLPKAQTGQTNEMYAHTDITQKKDGKSSQDEQDVHKVPADGINEAKQPNAITTRPIKHHVEEGNKPSGISPSTESHNGHLLANDDARRVKKQIDNGVSEPNNAYSDGKDANLYYASQSLEEDTTYQAPSKMDEFVAKIAEYNHVKAVPLDCTSDCGDGDMVNTAYVFKDTKELDLFARLLQAACSYDSETPGYTLNFSHRQFFFTLKDLRKDVKYLWMAERIDGGRILLFTSHSPMEANVSSVCYQKYREQLTHEFGTSQF